MLIKLTEKFFKIPFLARGLHATNPLLKKVAKSTEHDGIREITMDDPKTRNSLSMGMMDSILTELTYNVNDENLRCIVLSAKGTVFSTGHNLKEFVQSKGFAAHRATFAKCSDIIKAIHSSPVPVIAKVNGLAAAAGLQIMASCDIAVCTEKSTFSTPGANFGIFCSTPGVAISRVASRMTTSYMLFTGLQITAHEALTAGLVSKVVAEQQLDDEVNRICQSIKLKSRDVIKLGKEFYYRQLSMNIEEAYRKGADTMASNLSMEDGKEGILSFIEKRDPKWRS